VTGQPLTLTATVGLVAPSTGAPTGSVTFRDGTEASSRRRSRPHCGPGRMASRPVSVATRTRMPARRRRGRRRRRRPRPRSR
jgi:hypothetical protein